MASAVRDQLSFNRFARREVNTNFSKFILYLSFTRLKSHVIRRIYVRTSHYPCTRED